MFCAKCGKEIPDNVTQCPECGADVGQEQKKKFCQHCGTEIDAECIVCPQCGKQVGTVKTEQPQIVINNANNNANTNANVAAGAFKPARECNKWVAFLLCLFLGVVGGHKFYEGKIGMAILYIFTFGLCGIGVLVDLIMILTKPNPYYV